MSTAKFYENIAHFSNFNDFTDDNLFHTVPENWNVVITDIKGSTIAIKAGRYKDVNQVGAAAIAIVKNKLKTFEFPYVFGGDGASMIIHDDDITAVIQELKKLKSLARLKFDIELRVGIIPISELREKNIEINVGKYEITPGKSVAVFKGGGLSKADHMIKKFPKSQCFIS